jgi:hypothetical protein
MYSTAGQRQKGRTKHNPQQAAQNQPTSIILLGNSQSQKQIQCKIHEKYQLMAVNGEGFSTLLANT